MLSAKRANALNEKLAQFVAARPCASGAWGQKGKDDGAILFVFVGDRKMCIEVGYGLEGALTDAKLYLSPRA